MLKAIGLLILGTLVLSIPAALVASLFAPGGDLEKDPTALTIVLAAGLPVELVMLATALNFSVRKYRLPWRSLGLLRPQRGGFWSTIGLAVTLVIASFAIVASYFGLLGAAGVHPDTDLPEQTYASAGPIVVLAVLSLVFAPIMEEVFFRGFIFGGLRGRWGVLGAACGSGLLFASAHLGNPGAFYVVPPIAVVGALFAFGYAHSGSLAAPMLAHFIFNSLSFASGLATS